MINVWAGEVAMSRVATKCAGRGFGCVDVHLRVSHKRVGHEGLVNGTRRARGFNFHARFPVSADETKLPDTREKKPLVPRVGEWQKATTGTSLKMFS